MTEKCTTPSCPNTIKKAGYKLCYDCWKKTKFVNKKSQGILCAI